MWRWDIYVALGLEDDPASRGAIKLNKVLWWADFRSFRKRGRSVTGAACQKLPEGPAPVRLVPVRSRLEQSGAARLESKPLGAVAEHVLHALRQPAPVFNDDDLFHLNQSLRRFRGMTAGECSDFSHRMSPGWQTVKQQEIIPYETALVYTRPLTEAELAWAREVAVSAGYIPG